MENSKPYLKPRFKGSRFESHGFPMALLKDFTVLEDIIRSVAKHLYRADHNGGRIPQNFTDDISLELAGIEPGSCITVINIVVAACSGLLPGMGGDTESCAYFEKARDVCIREIKKAEADGRNSYFLPPSILQKFNQFGAGLREDESIEFSDAQNAESATFTQASRKRLLKASNIDHYSAEFSLYGTVSEIDAKAGKFRLLSLDNRSIPQIPYADDQFTELRAMLTNTPENGPRIQVRGIGRFTRDDRLDTIESVENITPLHALDIGCRLAEISCLKDGWLDGRGKAFDCGKVKELADLFSRFYALDALPYLYPSADNAVRAEWEAGTRRMSLDIDMETFAGSYYFIDLAADRDYSRELDMKSREGWGELCGLLAKELEASKA